MSKSGKKIVIGITGGMGSGKSVVAGEFRKLGCAVIDGDQIAHQLLEDAPVKTKVGDRFGKAVFKADGEIDRSRLAEVVFSDEESVASLNEIIHPLIIQRIHSLVDEYDKLPGFRAIALDMPLLFEAGLEKICDFVVFVDCKAELRMRRLRKFRGFDQKEVKKREKFQFSLDTKAKLADNIIDNNSDFAALSGQVAEIFSQFVGV